MLDIFQLLTSDLSILCITTLFSGRGPVSALCHSLMFLKLHRSLKTSCFWSMILEMSNTKMGFDSVFNVFMHYTLIFECFLSKIPSLRIIHMFEQWSSDTFWTTRTFEYSNNSTSRVIRAFEQQNFRPIRIFIRNYSFGMPMYTMYTVWEIISLLFLSSSWQLLSNQDFPRLFVLAFRSQKFSICEENLSTTALRMPLQLTFRSCTLAFQKAAVKHWPPRWRDL